MQVGLDHLCWSVPRLLLALMGPRGLREHVLLALLKAECPVKGMLQRSAITKMISGTPLSGMWVGGGACAGL